MIVRMGRYNMSEAWNYMVIKLYTFYHFSQLYHLCPKVFCKMCKLLHFIVKPIPLLKLVMTCTAFGEVRTILYFFGMTRTWTLILPNKICVCYN